MDAINIDAICVAEKWLQLDFSKARTEAIPNRARTAREVWNKSKEEEHKRNFRRITSETDRKPDMDMFGLLRNEAKRWGGNILVLGRQSVQGAWAIVVGAGGSFSASRGHNKAEVARDASMKWVTDLIKRCREAGPENVLVEWWAKDHEAGNWIGSMDQKRGNEWTARVTEDLLPRAAIQEMLAATRGEGNWCGSPWMLLRQLRHR